MELVSVAPVDVVRDIITSLPEILEDCQHNDIARELKYVEGKKSSVSAALSLSLFLSACVPVTEPLRPALIPVLCSSLLQTNTQLTVPILDSLSSLNLSASLLAEVVETLLYNMVSLKGSERMLTVWCHRSAQQSWPRCRPCSWRTCPWSSSSSCTRCLPLIHTRSEVIVMTTPFKKKKQPIFYRCILVTALLFLQT